LGRCHRDDLWQLLFVLTVRKAVNLVKYQGRKSRGGGRAQRLADRDLVDAEAILGAEPSPELAAQMTEECQRRDSSLDTTAGIPSPLTLSPKGARAISFPWGTANREAAAGQKGQAVADRRQSQR